MSLVYQDFDERRRRTRMLPQAKKVGRKRYDIDIDAQKIPGQSVAKKLITILANFDVTETDRFTIRDQLMGRPGFEHLNAEILAATIKFIRQYEDEQPKPGDFTPEKLDPYLALAYPKLDYYSDFTEIQKEGLRASVFRYTNWYHGTKPELQGLEGLEGESYEELSESESLEEEALEEEE